jgi:hypothetical protein
MPPSNWIEQSMEIVVWLFLLFILGVGNNVPSLVIATLVFLAFWKRRTPVGKAIAYCCFLFAGIAVAKLQWVIVGGQSGEALRWEIGTTEVLVGGLSILALIASARILKEESPLVALFVLTIVLAILQFSGIPYQVLNWYARFFSLAAIAVPLLVLAQSWNRSGPTED